MIGIDGAGDRRLTPPARRSVDPDWSPDGTRIVYMEARFIGKRRPTAQQRIAVMNADGTGRSALTAYGVSDELNPKWMPDGQTIVFEQWRRGAAPSDIYAVGAGAGAPRPILATPSSLTGSACRRPRR